MQEAVSPIPSTTEEKKEGRKGGKEGEREGGGEGGRERKQGGKEAETTGSLIFHINSIKFLGLNQVRAQQSSRVRGLDSVP